MADHDGSGEAPAALPRQKIGEYVVLGEIGRGGMGVVYKAAQLQPRRLVAVKVIQSHLASPRDHQRFAFEAEVLARLDHPGIARVLEARNENDESWYAMEYVAGEPLDVYARGLGLAERVALLAKLAEAVNHAHLHGVVHRDLKPSNVLVTADGQPKVLDFGIARAIDRDDSRGPRATRAGEIVGTPMFMSPEQAGLASAEHLDGRSDVYTLGVIAYELLAGRMPYHVEDAPLPEVLHTIRTVDPIPLGRLDKALRGDLETIVGKCLEKEPDRRYRSAAEVAEDLRRYLDHEPIRARPATARYQLVKFARRRPALLAALVTVFLSMGLGTFFSTLGFVTAERARRVAEHARAVTLRRTAQLILGQARTSLLVDPTMALAWLKSLPEVGDWPEALSVALEATRRGAASDLLIGHHGQVRWVAWSPDDRLLATASYDDDVRIWDRKARTVRVLHGHHADVVQVGWSADGRAVASADKDGVVRLWSATGEPLATHPGAGEAFAWSPVGRVLLTGSKDGKAVLWRDGTPTTADRLDGPVKDIEFSADGRLASVTTTTGAASLLHLDGSPPVHLVGHTAAVHQAVFSSDDRQVVTSSDDDTVRLWDVATGKQLARLDHDAEGRNLVFVRPDLVVATWRDGQVTFWDPTTSKATSHQAHAGVVRDIALSPDRTRIATGGDDGLVLLWFLDRDEVWRLLGHVDRVRHLAFSHDGRWLASAGMDHLVRIWDVRPARRAGYRAHTGAITALRYASDGRLVTASEDGTAAVYDPATGATRRLVGHLDQVDDAWPAGDLVITGSRDHTVRVWSPTGVRVLRAAAKVDAIAPTPDGSWVLAATRAPAPRLFDLRHDRAIDLPPHHASVTAVAFAPDQQHFATASAHGEVRLWRLGEQTPLRSEVLDGAVVGVAFAPDGSALVAGTSAGVVATLPTNGGPLHTDTLPAPVTALSYGPAGLAIGTRAGDLFRRGTTGFERVRVATGAVTDVAQAPDDSATAVASTDRTVTVLSGKTLLRWTGSSVPVRHVAFSPDGQHVAGASEDGQVRIWPTRADTSEAAVRQTLDALTTVRLDDDDHATATWRVLN